MVYCHDRWYLFRRRPWHTPWLAIRARGITMLKAGLQDSCGRVWIQLGAIRALLTAAPALTIPTPTPSSSTHISTTEEDDGGVAHNDAVFLLLVDAFASVLCLLHAQCYALVLHHHGRLILIIIIIATIIIIITTCLVTTPSSV